MLRVSAALLLAIGLVVSGWFVGNGFAHSRNERFVMVKGMAERDVEADIALCASVSPRRATSLPMPRRASSTMRRWVTAFLARHKLGKDAIAFRNVQVTDRSVQKYGNNEYKTRFIVTGTRMVRTRDVEAVAAAAQDTGP